MLAKQFYKHFGNRVKLNLLTSGALFDWDKETEHLKPAKLYMLLQMCTGVITGFWFCGIHLIQLYLKTHHEEIPEEGSIREKPTDLKTFATIMIEVGEILLCLCITFLGTVFCSRYKIFIYLFNQLIDYNKKLSEMIDCGKLVLTADQKNVIKLVTFLNYLVMFISSTLPFGIVVALQAEIEPTNRIIEEWLEFPFEISWQLSPLICLMLIGTFGTGTMIGMMMILIAFYYMTSLICTEALIPEEFVCTPKEGPGRCKITTSGFGKLTDLEVIQLHRIQQILNLYLNSFFRSVLVAFHHVGCLATVVTLLVFAIRYQDVISEEGGPMGYFVVFTCMILPFVMIFYQCKMAGAVVDISEDFKFAPGKIMPRKFLFRKFARSCVSFYIEVTYPFYKVQKETFSEFMQQAQDYSMELLLWDVAIVVGFWFCGIHALQIYPKTHLEDIPEDENTGKKPRDLRTFATLIIKKKYNY